MTHDDDLDQSELRELLAERAQVSDVEVEPLRRFVAQLPPRRRSWGRGILAAAAGIVVVLAGFGALAIATGPWGTSGAAPWPPNPAYFANDPRLAVCSAKVADAVAIFELKHLSDFFDQMPNALPLVSIPDSDAPALVIVRKGPGTPQLAGETPGTNSHDLCLVVGTDASNWGRLEATDVDTTGLLAFKPEPTGTPIASSLAPWADRCGGQEAGILAVVRVLQGGDLSGSIGLDPAPPELSGSPAGVVVVYDSGHPFAPLGTPPPGAASVEPRSPLAPGHHDICVLVGNDAATAARFLHEDIAVALASVVPMAGTTPSPSTASPAPSPTPSFALPSPIAAEDCAAMGFAPDRCLAVVEEARIEANLTWDRITTAHLTKPGPQQPSLGSRAVASVTFTLTDGSSVSPEVRCLFLGTQYSLVCSDHPEIRLSMPISGYYDVPCGAVPGGEPGSSCATPLPTVNPKATAVPLRIAAHDIPLATGHQELLVGHATLPNGVLSDASFSLADPTTQAFTVNGAVQLVIRSTDPSRQPFDNAYVHGWHPGSEVVNVYLVLDVLTVQPGATLQIRDLVVR